jgi:hypothetical protein
MSPENLKKAKDKLAELEKARQQAGGSKHNTGAGPSGAGLNTAARVGGPPKSKRGAAKAGR